MTGLAECTSQSYHSSNLYNGLGLDMEWFYYSVKANYNLIHYNYKYYSDIVHRYAVIVTINISKTQTAV